MRGGRGDEGAHRWKEGARRWKEGARPCAPTGGWRGRMGLFYVRFMDDWVILAPTRWKLRGAVKAVQELMGELKLVLHPDKTFIGRIARGFDFLGYWFTPEGLGIAWKSVERFAERVSQLYEQGAGENRIGEYVRRWWRWVRSGVGKAVGGSKPNCWRGINSRCWVSCLNPTSEASEPYVTIEATVHH